MTSHWDVQTFAFARPHPVLRPIFAITGMGPTRISIAVDDTEVTVAMGVGFQARVPRAAVTSAERYDGRVLGWGVHGWRGRWLVNTTSTGLVTLDLDPACHARLFGIPLRPRVLRLSLADADAFVAALAEPGTPQSIS
jgi:hypothetical protein